jgi:hypothetical protein
VLVKTRLWESTVRFFSDLEAHNEFFGPMRRLVAHIASQPYAALLFSTTSMHALLVAQHAEIESGHDVLRVEQDLNGRTVRFTYQEQEFVEPATWECDTEKVVETFEGFLRKAKWVSIGAIAGES